MEYSPTLRLAVMATTAATFCCDLVWAQQPGVVEEVTVTARKREESVLEVPESVVSMSAAMIERANLKSLKDIGLAVPNVYMTTRLDGFPNVSIRGLGGFGNTQGVGFYLDDVQLFSDASGRFGDLARIEVLKGPQGVLYGGSNIGGAIKFVTDAPDPEALFGNVRMAGGNFGYLDVEAQVNVPLSDTWALRLFGFGESFDGFLDNPNTPRSNGQSNDIEGEPGELERYGFRATVAGEVTDRLSASVSLRYNDFDGPNNAWIRELSGDLAYGNTVDTSFNPRHDRETTAGSIRLTQAFDAFDATLIASYTDTNSLRQSDLDIDQEWVLDLVRPENFEATTLELRFSSDGSGSLAWQAGGYLLDLDRELRSVLNIRGGFCFLDPGTCTPAPGQDDALIVAVAPFELSDRRREQRALFGNLTYRMGSWELSGGLRVDRWTSARTNLDTGLSGVAEETEILGRASLAWYSGSENTMVYGTVSQGFEPGDFNLTSFVGATDLFGFDEERALQFESGYKGRLLDGRLAVTAAAYFIDYSDRQFELQAADPAGGFIEGIVNVGDSRQWGLEFDALLNIGEYWILNVGAGYLDAQWRNGVISPSSGADLSGQTPPNIADVSLTTSLDYGRDLPNGMRFDARVQARHRSDGSVNAQFFDTPGDDFPAWRNPAFTVVDINAGLEWGSWELRLQIENLFDEEYYIDVQEFPNFAGSALPGSPSQIVIGTLEQPRRYTASLRYRF